MKKILQVLACFFAVAVGIGALLAGSNSSTSGDAEQILASEDAWAQAPVQGDTRAWPGSCRMTMSKS